MFSNTATTMVGSPCLTKSPFATLSNTQESKRGQMTQEVWPWCTVIGSCRCLLLPSLCFQWTLPMFSNTATTMVGSPCPTTTPFATFGNTQEPKRGQMTQEVWPWCTVIGSCRCLLLPSLCFQWTLPMFSNTATTMVGSPCPTTTPFATFGNTQEPKRGQMTQEVWPWCTVIGSCRCLLLPSLCFQWTVPMFSNTATTMVGSPCPTTTPFATFGNTQEPKRGQMTQEVWPWCTVIGSCRCLLLPSLCFQWTLAVFSNTATTMVGSPCPTTSPFATFGNTQESKRGQATQEVWPWCTVIGSCRCLLLPSLCFQCTLPMFSNTATTMVGSPCLTTSPFATFGNTQESKKRSGDPRGVAMVYCDWQLYMPFVAILVYPMDSPNVFKHCHNNGWLSLPHNKPICHSWQHSGVKKGASNPRGMAMVYCDWWL